MQEEQMREALNTHWHASAAGDANAEHDIYDDDAICDYPQSGERILGRSNLQALRSHHPGKPSGFNVKRILGNGDLWITEYTITYQGRPAYTVSIMEFRNGKVVHETQYFADPFEAPAWRSQWVQQIARTEASRVPARFEWPLDIGDTSASMLGLPDLNFLDVRNGRCGAPHGRPRLHSGHRRRRYRVRRFA